MNFIKKNSVLASSLALLTTFPLVSAVAQDSIGTGNGRVIMRAQHGELYSSIVRDNKLVFQKKKEGSKEWESVNIHFSDGQPVDGVTDISFDSSAVNGAFIAFTRLEDGKRLPYVVKIKDPVNDPQKYKVFGPLSNKDMDKGFIAVSKGFQKTLAYGWSTSDGQIHFGSSSSEFSKVASVSSLVSDFDLASGVGVSAYGRHMMVSYLSNNDKYCSGKCEGNVSVYLETRDSGKNWTAPVALFNSELDLPKLSKFVADGKEDVSREGGELSRYVATSGMNSPLAWKKAKTPETDGKGDQVYFITNTMIPKGEKVGGSSPYGIGVVSFREIKGGEWTHVVANNSFIENKVDNSRVVGKGHQYSALPGTPLRGALYTEVKENGAKELEKGLVLAISTDTGKTFDHFISLKPEDLGLSVDELALNGEGLTYRISACLYKDKDGAVYQDLLIMNDGQQLIHKQIATGVSVSHTTGQVL